MFIPSSGICENDNHDKIDNIWICLNKNCKQYPIFCSQCQKQLHNNHLGDCKDVQKFYTQINQQFKESLQEEVKIRKVYKAITSTYQKEIYNLQKIIDLLDQKNYQQINQYTNYNQNKSCLQYNPLLSAVEFFEEIEKTLKKNNNPVSTSDIYFEEQLCNDYQHKAEQLFKEGLNLWDQQQFTEALNCFNQSIQLNPCNYSIYAWKGRTLNKLQRYQEAKEACDIAINKDPLNDLAYSSKACALIKLTQFDQVIEYCDKAIQLNNNNDAAYNNKAIALGYYGRTDEQLQCYEQAIKVNKRNEQLYINKGFLLLKLKKFQESVDCCEEIIKFNSQFVEAYNLKGVALFELKKYDEAIQSFEKMHSISKCPRSLVAKADVLLNQGQKLQAKQIYVQALNSGFKDQGYLESKIKLI